MKKKKWGKWISKIALGCLGLVLSTGTIFGGKTKSETYAITTTDTTSYVSVGELFDTTSKTFDFDNFEILLKYISGNPDAGSVDDIASLAHNITDASVMRAKTLDAGDGYSAKTSSQDIIVRLGGLNWQVMYLSENKSGEPILTLWLDNAKQDAWADRSATEGTYYGFIDGALYSDWSANWYNSTVGTSPSNMYGASYINAVTLNNGGVYATNYSGTYTTVEKDAENPFALFTMEDYGLTEYIEKPRNVSWQENQSAKSIMSMSYNYPNDAWSKETSDDGFYSASYNYAELDYSDAWADSYIWLPSMSETGYSDSYLGLWKASVNQRKNFDGSTTSSQGSVGSTSGNAYPYSWLRSGNYINASYACDLTPSGSSDYSNRVNYSLAVRPSLHLNLNSVELSSTRVSIAGGEMALGSSGEVYNGKAKTPEVTVTLDGSPLARDTDYILTYSLNGVTVDEIKSVGEYTITAKGTGDYRGKLTATYTVTAQNLANITISTPSDQTYTGSAIAPTLTITDGDVALTQDTDYTIAYTNNTNVGTGTMTITGIGNYTGEATRNFYITALDISSSNISVSGVSSMTYTGSALEHTPTITHSGKTLTLNTDYTLSYKNNTNVGTATITIMGIGNYTGSRIIEFEINKASTTAEVECVDAQIYEGNTINLVLVTSSVSGSIATDISHYVAGEYVYNWTFVPSDTHNYEVCNGTITLTAIPLSVAGLVFEGDYKKEYYAYDKFDTTNLIVNIEYNSGRQEVIDESKYTLSIAKGSFLHVGDVVTVVYSLDENISAVLPIEISQRIISIASDIGDIVANGEKQYLNISFNNAENLALDKVKIEYKNTTNNTVAEYILERGLYRAIITILDEDFLLEEREIVFEVKSKTIVSVDNSLIMESNLGFGLAERINLVKNTDKDSVLQALGKSDFGVGDEFVAFYSFDLTDNQDVVVKFNPNVADLTQLKVYKLDNDNLTMISFTQIGDEEISISCNSSDKLYLFASIEDSIGTDGDSASDGGNKTLKLILIAFAVIACIGVVVVILANKIKRNQNLSYVDDIKNTSAKDDENNTSNTTMQINEKAGNKEDNSIYTEITNLEKSPSNMAQNPYQINVQTSNETNTQTNEDIQPQSPKMSYEEMIRQYVIFDANGKVQGLKPDAPEELKNAYQTLIDEGSKKQ